MFKVKVSPYLGVSEWVDPYSKITFSKQAGDITIPDSTDLTGIKKHIRLNQLFLTEGTVEDQGSPTILESEMVPETIEPEPELLGDKTVLELKEIAKTLEIAGYSSMRKAELVEAIENCN